MPLLNALIRGEPEFMIAKFRLKNLETSFYGMVWCKVYVDILNCLGVLFHRVVARVM